MSTNAASSLRRTTTPVLRLERAGLYQKPDRQSGALQIYPGEIVALLGPAGSGKSQIVAQIAGATKETLWKVYLNGANVTVSTPEERFQAGISKLPWNPPQGRFQSFFIAFEPEENDGSRSRLPGDLRSRFLARRTPCNLRRSVEALQPDVFGGSFRRRIRRALRRRAAPSRFRLRSRFRARASSPRFSLRRLRSPDEQVAPSGDLALCRGSRRHARRRAVPLRSALHCDARLSTRKSTDRRRHGTDRSPRLSRPSLPRISSGGAPNLGHCGGNARLRSAGASSICRRRLPCGGLRPENRASTLQHVKVKE